MITIHILPDDVLLEVFDCYVGEVREIEGWEVLVHVCRRWRCLLFGSPRRLNLQLVCTPRTPARALDIWPVLPLVIQGHISSISGVDNTVVALRRSSHIFKIDLWGSSGSESEELLAAMQQPFPEVTHLQFGAYDAPIIPDSFLGGSAPRLQYLHLEFIPFPGLPNLLLSSIHLVELHLHGIPQSGYLSPEVMVTCLSALTSLERLSLGFQSPQSYPNRESQRHSLQARSIFPTLTNFKFRGVSEYLDDFVARIDTPRLSNLHIIFFNQIDFDTPQLSQFIRRTPRLDEPDEAHVIFHHEMVLIRFLSRAFGHGELHVEISCSGLEWQLSSLTQVCALCLPAFSTVETLCIHHLLPPNGWKTKKNGIEDAQWLDFLRPFDCAKNLYLSRIFASGVGSSPELIWDRMVEVFPALQIIVVDGQKYKIIRGIQQFVDARRLTAHLDWFKVKRLHYSPSSYSPFVLDTSSFATSRRRRRNAFSLHYSPSPRIHFVPSPHAPPRDSAPSPDSLVHIFPTSLQTHIDTRTATDNINTITT